MNDATIHAAVRERGGFFQLSGQTILRLTGLDRVRYLNGQVSNDVRKLGDAATLSACVMNAKGRLCAHVTIAKRDDSLFIDAAPELRAPLAQRLERYIIADDALLEDVSDEWALFHVVAESCAEAGSRQSRRLVPSGFDLIVPTGEAAALRERLSAELVDITPAVIESLRIENGVPRWGAELDESTLPAEAGLDLSAVDFHKGCYVGQETVSRIKSIGHVNRTLRFLVGGEAAIPVGAQLFAANGAPAGKVTSSAWSFALSRQVALGYVKRGVDAPTLLARLGDEAGLEVEVRAVQHHF